MKKLLLIALMIVSGSALSDTWHETDCDDAGCKLLKSGYAFAAQANITDPHLCGNKTDFDVGCFLYATDNQKDRNKYLNKPMQQANTHENVNEIAPSAAPHSIQQITQPSQVIVTAPANTQPDTSKSVMLTENTKKAWRDYLPDNFNPDKREPSSTLILKSQEQPNAGEGKSTFHGKECKGNCQGHIAGYRWAKTNSIDDEAACMTPSPSFAEGCASYVEENGFFGMARGVISWLFIISGGFFMASGLLGSIKSYFHVIAGSVMIMAGWFAKGMYAWWPLLVGAGIAFYMAKLFVMKQKSDMINAMYGYK